VEAGGGLLLRSESFGGSSSDLGALVAASPFGVRENILVDTIHIHLSRIQIQKGRPRYKRSLQLSKREHPALQYMEFYNFFLLFGVIFAGSTDLIDPDPKPWS
jgi:hypothetical protein